MTGRCDPIHPDDILAEELKAIGMSVGQLAEALEISTNHIALMVEGKDSITVNTALRLGSFFGTGPELWLDIQKAYARGVTNQMNR